MLAAINSASYDLASKVELSITVSIKCETFAMNGMTIGSAISANDYVMPNSLTEVVIGGGLLSLGVSILTSQVNLSLSAAQTSEPIALELYPKEFAFAANLESVSVDVDQDDVDLAISAAISAISRLNASDTELAIGASIQAVSQAELSDSSIGLAIALDVSPFDTGVFTTLSFGAGVAIGDGWMSQFGCGIALEGVSTPVEVEYSFLGLGAGLEVVSFEVTVSETSVLSGFAISVDAANIPDSTTTLQSGLGIEVNPIDLDSSIIQLTLGVSLQAIPEDFPSGDEFLLLVL